MGLKLLSAVPNRARHFAAILSGIALASVAPLAINAQQVAGVTTFEQSAPLSRDAKPKAMVIQDFSGSMWGKINGQFKFDIARRALTKAIKNTGSDVDLGLIAYGHRSKDSCRDIEIAAFPGANSAAQVVQFVENTSPLGRTPLAASLRRAAEVLSTQSGTRSVVLFTDGLETCNGDPCAVAREFAAKGLGLKVNVIGFDVGNVKQTQLQCVASVTGGKYFNAENELDLSTAFGESIKEVIPTIDRSEILRLLKRIAELEAQLAAAQQENLELGGSLALKDATMLELDRQISALKARLEDSENQFAALDKALEASKISNADLSQQNLALAAELTASKAAAEGADRVNKALETALAEAKEQQDAAKRRIEGLEGNLSAATDHINALNGENSALKRDLADANSLLDLANLDSDEAAKQIKDLNADLNAATASIGTLEADKAGLLDKLDAAAAEKQALQDQNKNLAQQGQELAKALEANKDALDAMKRGRNLLAGDKVALEGELAALRAALSDANQRNKNLDLALANSEDARATAEERLTVFANGLESAIAISEQLESTLDTKQDAIETGVKQLASNCADAVLADASDVSLSLTNC